MLLIPFSSSFYCILDTEFGRSPTVEMWENVIFNHNWREISLDQADRGKGSFLKEEKWKEGDYVLREGVLARKCSLATQN